MFVHGAQTNTAAPRDQGQENQEMTNHPNRSKSVKIARAYIAAKDIVERVRVRGEEVHAYGIMPNSDSVGWYLAGYVNDLVPLAIAEERAR
jgi:hypothetical protein